MSAYDPKRTLPTRRNVTWQKTARTDLASRCGGAKDCWRNFTKDSPMAEPEVEAAWRAEFKRSGATELHDASNSGDGSTDELKRQAAFHWPGDETVNIN